MNAAFKSRLLQFAVGLIFAGAASAQGYPARPVKLVVPFPAGSQADTVARIVSIPLQQQLNQPVIIENKPGAGGAIAADSVARSMPDGYTLMMTTAAIQAANVSLYTKLPYNPVKDFAPIARVATTSMMLMVRPDFPASTVEGFIEQVRGRNGKISAAYGSPGAQVAVALLEAKANIKVLQVPYKGIPQAMTDLMGGIVDFTFVDTGNAIVQAKSGKLRALGVASPDRVAIAPDVPALKEKLPGFELVSWFGVVAAAGTPLEVVSHLSRNMAMLLNRQDVKDSLIAVGTAPALMESAQFGGYIQQEIDTWAKLTKLAGIKPE